MIIGQDVKPDNQIYALGARLIRALGDLPGSLVDIDAAYVQMNQERAVSARAFFLTLDWLFLIGALESVDGRVQKCF